MASWLISNHAYELLDLIWALSCKNLRAISDCNWCHQPIQFFVERYGRQAFSIRLCLLHRERYRKFCPSSTVTGDTKIIRHGIISPLKIRNYLRKKKRPCKSMDRTRVIGSPMQAIDHWSTAAVSVNHRFLPLLWTLTIATIILTSPIQSNAWGEPQG